MRETIAIDIDEVLFGFNERFLSFHNERYKTQFLPHHLPSMHCYKVLGGTPADDLRKVGEFQADLGNLDGEPVPRSVDSLSRLKSAYNLVIITARTSNMEQQTRKWLAATYPETFSNVHFANYYDESRPRRTKGDVCRDLGVDRIIDDQPSYIEDCLSHGVKGILFGDYAWNREATLHPEVLRAKDWAEVERILL